jgi:hypothetical protein
MAISFSLYRVVLQAVHEYAAKNASTQYIQLCSSTPFKSLAETAYNNIVLSHNLQAEDTLYQCTSF